MELAKLVGCNMMIASISGRTFVGIVAFINPQNLTITLADVWSENDFFDLIIIKATDILYYDFMQDSERKCAENESKKPLQKTSQTGFQKVPQKFKGNYKRKARYIPKKVISK